MSTRPPRTSTWEIRLHEQPPVHVDVDAARNLAEEFLAVAHAVGVRVRTADVDAPAPSDDGSDDDDPNAESEADADAPRGAGDVDARNAGDDDDGDEDGPTPFWCVTARCVVDPAAVCAVLPRGTKPRRARPMGFRVPSPLPSA